MDFDAKIRFSWIICKLPVFRLTGFEGDGTFIAIGLSGQIDGKFSFVTLEIIVSCWPCSTILVCVCVCYRLYILHRSVPNIFTVISLCVFITVPAVFYCVSVIQRKYEQSLGSFDILL